MLLNDTFCQSGRRSDIQHTMQTFDTGPCFFKGRSGNLTPQSVLYQTTLPTISQLSTVTTPLYLTIRKWHFKKLWQLIFRQVIKWSSYACNTLQTWQVSYLGTHYIEPSFSFQENITWVICRSTTSQHYNFQTSGLVWPLLMLGSTRHVSPYIRSTFLLLIIIVWHLFHSCFINFITSTLCRNNHIMSQAVLCSTVRGLLYWMRIILFF